MIKKHQKLIAMTVVLTFLALLQVSAMPLRAEQSPAQTETALGNAEQGPNFVEEEGTPYAAKKKSIVPIVLIGLGVVAVAAVLVLVVLKTKYDPVGSWTGTFKSQTQTWTATVVFTGDKKTGTVVYDDPYWPPANGTYTVSDKDITFNYTLMAQTVTHTGKFDGKNTMSGTWKNEQHPTVFGTWTLTRGATTANHPTPMNLAGGNKGAIKE